MISSRYTEPALWRRAMAGAILAVCGALTLLGGRGVSGNQPAAPPSTGGILVAFKQPAGLQSRVNALDRAGLMVDSQVRSPFFTRVVLAPGARAAGVDSKAALRQLQRDPAVRVAEPDYVQHTLATPNDTRYSELWGLHNTGQSGGSADADIDAPEAWELNQGSDSVVVAVIDTGVDYNHPDLTQNILRNASNQVIGFDYANNDPDPMDDNEHGTHCAGTIGGRGNNGLGVAGVNWRAKIMPLKFLSAEGSGNTSAAIQCIDFARTNGARVMSNSWGGGGFSQLLLEAIQRARAANILFIAAAGNDSENTDAAPHYPSNYAEDNVVSVGASDRNDQRASFSNFGAVSVDLFAPGASIVSTTPNNTYSSFSGTSMATPHVAGAAALVLAQFPSLTAAQVKARILGGVDLPASFGGLCVTGGRLNLNNSLDTDTTAPGSPTNLRATHRAASAVLLAWTNAGDDGTTGTASRLDVRYSVQPITAANFAAATQALNAPTPLPTGSGQSFLLAGLDPNTSYHFAIKAVDNVGNLSSLTTTGPVVTLTVDCPLDDNVEGSPRFTGQSPWGVTTAASVSPTRSYTDSPNGQYANSTDVSLTQTSAVSITGVASITFKAKHQLEAGYDYLYIEVTADNGASWQRQSLALNGSADWTAYTVPLDVQSGSIRARFRLITDSSVTLDGVYLDDIKICILPVTSLFTENVEGAPQLSGNAPWAVTTETSVSPTHSYADSPGSAYGNGVDLSLTTNASPVLSNVIPTLTFSAKTDLERGYDNLYVEASTNGGGTWQRLSLSLTDVNDWRSYSILLSQFLGQNLKLRFRLITDGSVTGDGVWLDDIRIVGPQLVPVGVPCLVTVSAPNGGDSWAPGSNQTVTWTSEGLTGNVNIELSTNGGNTYTMLQANTPNDGSQIVTVPNTVSNQCRIRVSAVSDASCQDVSNTNFTIGALPCTVTVSAPNGGERWAQATSQMVSWSSQNLVGDVKIELSTNDGTSFSTLLANTPNDGSQSVTLPSTPSVQCRIRVSAVNDANCQDVSNANFEIYNPGSGGSAFALANGTLSPGGNVALNLQFTASGAQPVTAAGFDLLFDTTKITAITAARGSLPDGVSVLTNIVSAGRTRCLIFGAANRTPFSSGNLITVTVTAAAALSGSSTQVQVVLPNTSTAGVQVTDPGGSTSNASATPSTIQFGLRGDLNSNGSIDVGDIQILVNVFLGSVTYLPARHDLNGNGGIDVGDIQQLVNLFLGIASPARPVRVLTGAGATFAFANTTVSPGGNVSVGMTLNTKVAQVAGIGFDLTFDASKLTLTNVTKGNVPENVVIGTNVIAPGRVRVAMYNAFGGTAWTNGNVLSVHFTAAPNFAGPTAVSAILPTLASSTAGVQTSDPDGNVATAAVTAGTITTPLEATLAVTAPNGGESWQVGTTHNITWSSANISGNVKLEYSTNGGGTWTTIVASTVNDGNEAWTVPNSPTSTAQVRVSAVDNSAVDTSNTNFAIAYVGGILNVPSSVNFGTIRSGRSVTRKITIINNSRTANLQVTVASSQAPFQVVRGVGNHTLRPRAKLVVQVRCSPTAAGVLAGALPITSSDPNRPSASVAFRGRVR